MTYPDFYKIQSWSLKFQMLKDKKYYINQEWYLKLEEHYPKEPIKVINTREELIDYINFLNTESSPEIVFKGCIFLGEISLTYILSLLGEKKISNIVFQYCFIEKSDSYGWMPQDGCLVFNHVHLNDRLSINNAEMLGLNLLFVKVPSIFISDSNFKRGIYLRNVSSSSIRLINIRNKSTLTLDKITSNKEIAFENIEVQNIDFNDSNIELLEMKNVIIEDTFISNNLELGTFNAQAVVILKSYFFASNFTVHNLNRETCQFIVTEAKRRNNNILAMEYKAKEMELYRKEVRHWKTASTFVLLSLNKCSNKYGKSWVRGLIFVGKSWILFFSLFVIFRDGWGDTFIWTDSAYLKEAVNYLWLLDSLNEISNCEAMNWWMIAVFILGKVLIAYGIYQTISAFRRFGK